VIRRLSLELVAFALRRFPSERGRWRVVPAALRWSQTVLPADGCRTVRTRDGFRLRVRLSDWLGRHVYVTGEYEPATAAALRALLGPGDTFIDVGANVGYFSLLASRRVGGAGRVYAFEPVPATHADLLENLRLNHAGNVSARSEALAEAPGEARFFVGPVDHRGTSSLRALDDASEVLTVRKARLDDLLPPGIRVNVMKIDVEGAEYLALQGMRACLRRDRPDLIVEVTDSFLRGLGHSAAELHRYLGALGYRMYAIDHDGLRPIAGPGSPLPSQFNALFTARAQLPAALRVHAAPAAASPAGETPDGPVLPVSDPECASST
jgi:FkbM family methyltransferase